MFSIDDLYQSQEKPSTLASNRWVINGTVDEVHYDPDYVRILTSDGEVTVKFYTAYMGQQTAERLQAALHTGNIIKCITY